MIIYSYIILFGTTKSDKFYELFIGDEIILAISLYSFIVCLFCSLYNLTLEIVTMYVCLGKIEISFIHSAEVV